MFIGTSGNFMNRCDKSSFTATGLAAVRILDQGNFFFGSDNLSVVHFLLMSPDIG